MDDHIIKAAQQAGFRTGNITLSDSEIKPIPFIAPVSATDCQHEVARLYAIAFKAGMERAAEICDDKKEKTLASQRPDQFDDLTNVQIRMVAHLGCENCAEAIRAHAQNQPKPIHDSSVV